MYMLNDVFNCTCLRFIVLNEVACTYLDFVRLK